MSMTVRDATYDLLRRLGLTTFFGNPGSTEETFLAGFPSDFRFVLALQEASAIAIADGWAQGMRRPALVNLHTAAGLGNAMGNLMTSFQNKTPLIVTAGNQTRQMLLMEPWLTNPEPTVLPAPWVKWAYQPQRPEDVPAAFMRAYAVALQPPAGPVFLSLPLDDWDAEALGTAALRSVATRVAPDPDRLGEFAAQLAGAVSPALVLGASVARSQSWDDAVLLAERSGAAVYAAPAAELAPFPEDHPQYIGGLPFAQGPLAQRLECHDLVLVIGAPVFRYYPWAPGPYLPDGCALLHITDDPAEAGRAPIGDSLIGDSRLAMRGLLAALPAGTPVAQRREKTEHRMAPQPVTRVTDGRGRLTARAAFAALHAASPSETVLVEESPSNLADLHAEWPVVRPDTFYTFASGGLGWNLPASVGLALAERDTGRGRPVVAVIGDGSFQYSVQAIWTAAAERLPVLFVVMQNDEYAILKAFAQFEHAAGVPGLDIPGMHLQGLAEAYGCSYASASTADEITGAVCEALERTEQPTLLRITIEKSVPPLL